jgi:hypothetical protein
MQWGSLSAMNFLDLIFAEKMMRQRRKRIRKDVDAILDHVIHFRQMRLSF